MTRYCRDRGTAEIKGQILRDNRDMLRLVRRLGFSVRHDTEEDVIEAKRPCRDAGH